MEKIPGYYSVYGLESADPGTSAISEVERLMNDFEAHEDRKKEFLRRYKELAEKSKNSLIQFLLKLIISDEEKRHAVTHAMVSTLKGDLTWTKPNDAIREITHLGEEEKKELLDLTE